MFVNMMSMSKRIKNAHININFDNKIYISMLLNLNGFLYTSYNTYVILYIPVIYV